MDEFLFKHFGWLLGPFAAIVRKRMRLRREIAGEVRVSSQWTGIELDPPVEIKRRFQQVILVVEGLSEPIDPENMTYRPEIRLVDDLGNSYDFNEGWQTANEMRFSPAAGLPRGRVYPGLALRCDDDFQCSKIIWHDFNLK